MPKQSVKHRVLTVKEKLELIQAIERGVKKAALAREKGLPLTTVCTIWNSREKLWNSDAAANLKSNGWLARFKARYNIVSKVVSGESAEANKDGAEAWENGQLRQILQDYDPEDIFNMDESALFFKLLPNRTLAFSGETCSGGKHSKDRISVAFAVNMTGNEKLPLLVIGKAAKPRCFKGGRLPSNVLYRNNGKAWMTAVLFEEYVRLLDRRFAAKNRRVVVVLDNASSHVDVANLTAIKGVGDRFRVAKSTVLHCVRRVGEALLSLASRFVTWPNCHEAWSIIDGFQRKSEFPGILGAIDGSHIAITAPTEHAASYINRKGLYSVEL
ncbi:tigger transposable element-derived protein 4-like [Ornithodoros turicata]|uniref:tigger transposable element-derived protein 4-like n=1 Tax=Ornithodoros turicata TaxID=34597 RepID=UPI003138A94E